MATQPSDSRAVRELTPVDVDMPTKGHYPIKPQSQQCNRTMNSPGADNNFNRSKTDMSSQTFLTQINEPNVEIENPQEPAIKEEADDIIEIDDLRCAMTSSMKRWADDFLSDSVSDSGGHGNFELNDMSESDNNDPGYDSDSDKDQESVMLDELHTLYLEECKRLGVLPVSYFLRHITEHEFIMRNHGLGPLGARALAAALEKNTNIERINLEGNDIQAGGAQSLCKMLKENFYITDLYLPENALGSDGSRLIFEMMTTNHLIARLDLSGNAIQDCDGRHLCAMLDSNTVLKFLYLRNNHLAEQASFALKDALANNETLELLDISWNHIRTKGAVAVSEGIAENIGLKYLNLSMNGFGLEGSRAMGKAMQTNRTLRELDLSWNRIPHLGGEALGKGLAINDILRVLKIGNNPLSAAGALAILSGVVNNEYSHIDYLDFVEIFVTQTFVDMKSSTERGRTLNVVHGDIKPDNGKGVHIVEYDFIAAYHKDPMTVLKRYAESNGLRLVDLFRQFDKDSSMSVNREEFVNGVRSAGIDMSQHQIDSLINKLDKDGDGEIDYAELLDGDKKNRQTKRVLEQVKAENEKIKEAVINDTNLDTVVVVNKISTNIEEMSDIKRRESTIIPF